MIRNCTLQGVDGVVYTLYNKECKVRTSIMAIMASAIMASAIMASAIMASFLWPDPCMAGEDVRWSTSKWPTLNM